MSGGGISSGDDAHNGFRACAGGSSQNAKLRDSLGKSGTAHCPAGSRGPAGSSGPAGSWREPDPIFSRRCPAATVSDNGTGYTSNAILQGAGGGKAGILW